MIKIGQYIRVNIFTVILFVICIITRQSALLFVTYFAIFLHEAAHLAAARAIGLRVESLNFYPFGVNLRLKNRIIYGLCDEVILYAAGPALNILLALIIMPLTSKSAIADYFYSCNIVLFFINILPILPLDGGVILKKLLACRFGHRTAVNCLRVSSAVLIAALITVEAVSAFKAGINYSVVLMTVFLIGNIFTQNEKYDIDFIRELMYGGSKIGGRANVFVARDDADLKSIAKKFTQGRYGIVICVNAAGEITDTLTEKQIIDSLVKR